MRILNESAQLLFFLDLKYILDEMGSRIDDLEKNISDLMHQAGIDDEPATKK